MSGSTESQRPTALREELALEGEIAQLRAELVALREERQRAECMASIQRDAVQLALDLLVTHPDLRGFFRVFIKRLVDESEAHACGAWLLDEATGACDLWMANVGGETATPILLMQRSRQQLNACGPFGQHVFWETSECGIAALSQSVDIEGEVGANAAIAPCMPKANINMTAMS